MAENGGVTHAHPPSPPPPSTHLARRSGPRALSRPAPAATTSVSAAGVRSVAGDTTA